MEAQHTIGFAHFMSQTDGVGRFLLLTLAAMSIVTWYLIIVKITSVYLSRRHTRAFLDAFWNLPTLDSAVQWLSVRPAVDCYTRLSSQALAAAASHDGPAVERLATAGGVADFLNRSMRRVIEEHNTRLESGLTVLASIGSTAPFIGLFGTVWGVYHALLNIGASGRGTLDQVAGPVGEALIMTALGLAVAIPAVLAYNFTVRCNRVALARLNAHAHDLYALLMTGDSPAPRLTGKSAQT